MIKQLKILNIGPSDEMELSFGDRFNVITGNNGLGKSFILDTIWFCLTGTWPNEIEESEKLESGYKLLPEKSNVKPSIDYILKSKSKNDYKNELLFNLDKQRWIGKAGRPANPGLVFYALADGSFAWWDPIRNYWNLGNKEEDKLPAYLFTQRDIIRGIQKGEDWVCEGIIRDLISWQTDNTYTERIDAFKLGLGKLSPNGELRLGPILNSLSIKDVSRQPSFFYLTDKPIRFKYLSSALKRSIQLLYLMVWAWFEFKMYSEHLGKNIQPDITFLIDEPEQHLHPNWQRSILPSILEVLKGFTYENDIKTNIQIIATTHSPILMSSLEEIFEIGIDAWFDLDLEEGKAILTKRDFHIQGSISSWLESEAFDFETEYNKVQEEIYNRARAILEGQSNGIADSEIIDIDRNIMKSFHPDDIFYISWKAFFSNR